MFKNTEINPDKFDLTIEGIFDCIINLYLHDSSIITFHDSVVEERPKQTSQFPCTQHCLIICLFEKNAGSQKNHVTQIMVTGALPLE